MQMSIHFCYANTRCWVYWDKQLVVPILQSSAIKPLQKERVQRGDAPLNPKMVLNHEENVTEI